MRAPAILFAVACLAAAVSAPAAEPGAAPASPGAAPGSLFEIETTTLDGKPFRFADHRGKVVLVVNVASRCGFTPQYQGLQALHDEMAGKGLLVVGVPSNDFGGQEPGSAEEIAAFCRKNYGVTFPVLAKSVVKPGPDQSRLYSFLTAGGEAPSWNFGKHLVGKDGKVAAFFSSNVAPGDPALRERIRAEIGR